MSSSAHQSVEMGSRPHSGCALLRRSSMSTVRSDVSTSRSRKLSEPVDRTFGVHVLQPTTGSPSWRAPHGRSGRIRPGRAIQWMGCGTVWRPSSLERWLSSRATWRAGGTPSRWLRAVTVAATTRSIGKPKRAPSSWSPGVAIFAPGWPSTRRNSRDSAGLVRPTSGSATESRTHRASRTRMCSGLGANRRRETWESVS